MLQKIKTKYNLTDRQAAILKYFLTVLIGETSKIILIGFLFWNQYATYLWCVLLLALLRAGTGGAHCHTYLGCLAASAAYFILCISILPYIEIPCMIRLALLTVCAIVCLVTGPVTSKTKKILLKNRVSKKPILFVIVLIGCFIAYSWFYPETPVAVAGFWVIMLNTLQTITTKIKTI